MLNLACWVEFDEKQPRPQGISTSAMLSMPTPSGHSSNDTAISASAAATATFGPIRSITRVSTTLPINPKAPNHTSSRAVCCVPAPSTWR